MGAVGTGKGLPLRVQGTLPREASLEHSEGQGLGGQKGHHYQ